MVHYRQRPPSGVANDERILCNAVELHTRHTGVIRFKNVPEFPVQCRLHALCRVDRHVLAAAKIERTNVIQSRHVVLVLVREDHRIEGLNPRPEALLAKIRPGVNDHRRSPSLHQQGTSQPLIPRVFTLTNFTVTANDGHALRGTCAEKCEFHLHEPKVRPVHLVHLLKQAQH